MEPNYLHIWPRNTFMMIALPNLVSGGANSALHPPLFLSLSIQKPNPLPWKALLHLWGVSSPS